MRTVQLSRREHIEIIKAAIGGVLSGAVRALLEWWLHPGR